MKNRKDFYINKLERELNISNLKDYLYDLYVNQNKTSREIAEIIYGKSKNSPNILKWLHYFEIPIRKGSEAIKAQYIGEKGVTRKQIASKNVTNGILSPKSIIKIKKTQNTMEYRNKISVSRMGELNPNFNVHLSNEERAIRNRKHGYRGNGNNYWVRKVKERDNKTCQLSGIKSNLIAHHLNNYDNYIEERFDLKNGITISENLHKLFHKLYGKNSTKEQFQEFKQRYEDGEFKHLLR